MIFLIATDTCWWIGCPISELWEYKEIYSIKKRDYKKPLAIMVESFDWLEEHTDLNKEQIEFLKNYNKPFSILTNCDKIRMYLEFAWEYEDFPNFEEYEQFSFRVAHNNEQKELIKKVWPVFLTSANFSWESEIYKLDDLKKQFKDHLKKVKILSDYDLDENIKPSDIFEFEGEWTQVIYLRKNN